MTCSASSSNCVIGEDDHEDIDMGANKIFDSSVSNEESSTKKEEADSFKLYGCGICCQSFSTKEEAMHCFHSRLVLNCNCSPNFAWGAIKKENNGKWFTE